MLRSTPGIEPDVVIPAAGETFAAEDGTISVVMADNLDENYEPTRGEIEEFASWMGMELPADEEFLWIAREGLKAPLPADWRPCRTNEDEIYYFNFRTGESTWNHPMDEQFRLKFTAEKERARASRSAATPAPVGVVQKTAPAKSTAKTLSTAMVLKTHPIAATTTSSERRIVSEAERGLEARIRQEREEKFREEVEKAEQILEERLQSMRRTCAAEAERLRESIAASCAESAALEEARRALEAKWRAALNEARGDEAELRSAIDGMPERHAQRVAAAAAAERARAQSAAEEKGPNKEEKEKEKEREKEDGGENEAQRVGKAAQAQCDALRRKALDEAREVRAAAARRGDEGEKELRSRHAEALAEKLRKETNARVAAAAKKTAEEVAALRAAGDERLCALRRALSVEEENEKVNENKDGDNDEEGDEAVLDLLRDRLRAEEALRLCELEERRRLSLLLHSAPRPLQQKEKVGEREKEKERDRDREREAAEWATAERQLRTRYGGERALLMKAAEDEVAAIAAHTRRAIDDDTAAQLREILQRGSGRKRAEGSRRQTARRGGAAVPAAELDRRLRAMEETFAAREAALLAELRDASRPISIPTIPTTTTTTTTTAIITTTPASTPIPTPKTPIAATPVGKALRAHAATTPPAEGSTPFASEALRFLSATQRETGLRSEALHAAREEWHTDVRNANAAAAAAAAAAAVANRGKAQSTVGVAAATDPTEAQLLSLIGAVSARIDKLAGTVASLRRESPARDARLTRRSPARRARSPQSPRGLVRKWSQILLDLAPPPMGRSEFSALIQRDLIAH